MVQLPCSAVRMVQWRSFCTPGCKNVLFFIAASHTLKRASVRRSRKPFGHAHKNSDRLLHHHAMPPAVILPWLGLLPCLSFLA